MTAGSVIGRGSVVRGNVRGEGDLEIHGRVEGDIHVTGDVTLGEEALVRGNITAAQVSVAGAVQGDLRGNEAVLIERGGRVIGDLTSPRIGIAPGALVRGGVRTDGEAPLALPQRRTGGAQSLRAGVSGPNSVPRSAVSPKVEPLRVAPAPAPPPVERFSERAGAASAATAIAPFEDAEPEPESSPEPAPVRREAPPPIVPALAKGAKAKKKGAKG